MIQQWSQIIDYKNGTQIFKTKTEKTQISSYLWQNMIFSCLRKVFGPILLWRGFWDLISIFAPRLCKRSSCVWSYLKSYGSQWGRDTWKLCFSQFSITETSTQIQMHLCHNSLKTVASKKPCRFMPRIFFLLWKSIPGKLERIAAVSCTSWYSRMT